MTSLIEKSFKQVPRFLLIVFTLSYLSAKTEPYVEAIVIQNVPESQTNNFNLGSFAGIMFLQKTFICCLAYILKVIWNSGCNSLRKVFENENKKSVSREIFSGFKDQSSDQSCISNDEKNQVTNTKRLNWFRLIAIQILIGLASFLSIQLLAQVELRVNVTQMIVKKNVNILFMFVVIHVFIYIPKFKWKTYCFKSLTIQDQNTVCEVIKSLLCLVPLVKAKIFLLSKSGLQQYYDRIVCPQFCRNKGQIDKQAIKMLNYTLVFDCVMFGGLYWIRMKKPHVNALELLISMTKFTALFFALYGLYTGELLQTLKVVIFVPWILDPLCKLFALNFGLFLLYSYSICKYPPLLFFGIFTCRDQFYNYFHQIVSQNEQIKGKMYTVTLIISILILQSIRRKNYEQFYLHKTDASNVEYRLTPQSQTDEENLKKTEIHNENISSDDLN